MIVNDEEAQIMLAGDASYLEATILNGTVDGISPNKSIAKATLARKSRNCVRIVQPSTCLRTTRNRARGFLGGRPHTPS